MIAIFIIGVMIIFSRKVERVIFSYRLNECIIKYVYVWKISEVVLNINDISYTRIVSRGHSSASHEDLCYRIVVVVEGNNREIEILETKDKKKCEGRLRRIKKFIEVNKIFGGREGEE